MNGKRTIGVILNRDNMSEFSMLAKEAGYIIVGYVFIRRFTGKGLSFYKIREIKAKMNKLGATDVVFDVSLKPKHLYNIAKELGVEPKDRLEIILEIFKLHSPSREADLQIKLASLQHELARAKERVRLRKLGEQTAVTRGLGAYEVDLYYNEIQRRIQNIKGKLQDVRKKRDIHRVYRKKKGYKTISIVGYYSSGKTTLFNQLADMREITGEEPFTTLSTKFGLIRVGAWRCYIIDTIGFISDLPPFMVTAFYSTLEEITFSDVVLLLIDVSESFDKVRNKFLTSWEILRKLGYKGTVIIVGNKIDEINNIESLNSFYSLFQEYSEHVVLISAKYGKNIEDVIEKIRDLLGDEIYVDIKFPYGDGWSDALSLFKDKFGDYEIVYEDEYIFVSGYIDKKDIFPIKQYVSKLGGSLIVEEESVGIEADA